jgi:hypothetical protein
MIFFIFGQTPVTLQFLDLLITFPPPQKSSRSMLKDYFVREEEAVHPWGGEIN